MSQIPLEIDARPRADLDNFEPVDNGGALAMAREMAAGSQSGWVRLVGPPGSGKTHLLTATVANARRSGREALYINCRMVDSAGLHLTLTPDGLLCLDEIDVLMGNPEMEEAAFHLANRLKQAGSGWLMASRVPVRQLPIELPDLRSRLMSATVFQMTPPADEDKKMILKKRARQQGIDLSDEVLDFLLKRLPRDLDSLSVWLDRIAERSLVKQKRVTKRMVSELIASAD